jgi:hypothetical protein
MWENIEEQKYIAFLDCKDRKLYRINARNFNIGVYNEKTLNFFGLRTKFGDTFIDDENHWDCEEFPTAKPIEELPEELPTNIENGRCSGTKCRNCQKLCEYVLWPEGGEKEITLSGGGKMITTGEWRHLKEAGCKEVDPVGLYNYALDGWLREMEKKYLVKI